MQPFGVSVDLVTGALSEPDNVIVRKASDMKGYYKDEAALERLIEEQSDPVHYEVFEKRLPEEAGHFQVCISKLYPGVVGEECYMTKGHYHAVADTAEVYLGIQGQGYMLQKLPDGTCVATPMKKGKMVYVPPYWAHRSVNTGDTPLISFCVYRGDAGHNYGDIATEGFPKRIFIRDGEEVIE
jgi:glucose-6-phosphate isomerase